jgi:hypothetical protein
MVTSAPKSSVSESADVIKALQPAMPNPALRPAVP